MKILLFVLLTLSMALVHADEVFKCQQKSGKTVYQSEPCGHAEKQQTIELPKIDPQKMAEEAAKLKAWEDDFAKREAERVRIEKEMQNEKDRKAALEALKQNAEFQRQQAIDAQRRAEESERQSLPYQFYPYYFPSRPHISSDPRHRKHEQHNDRPKNEPPYPNPGDGIKLPDKDNGGQEPTRHIFK